MGTESKKLTKELGLHEDSGAFPLEGVKRVIPDPHQAASTQDGDRKELPSLIHGSQHLSLSGLSLEPNGTEKAEKPKETVPKNPYSLPLCRLKRSLYNSLGPQAHAKAGMTTEK